jgi:hypothetical protein
VTRYEHTRIATTVWNAASGGDDADGGGVERDSPASGSDGVSVPSGDAAAREGNDAEPATSRFSTGRSAVTSAGVGLWYAPTRALESGHFRLGWALVAGLVLLAGLLLVRYLYAR